MKTNPYFYKSPSEFQRIHKRQYHKSKHYDLDHQKFSKYLSDYAKFHLHYLGYQFQNRLSGEILTKGEFWDMFQDSYQAEYQLIEYSPSKGKGWISLEEMQSHFQEVAVLYAKSQDEIHELKIANI